MEGLKKEYQMEFKFFKGIVVSFALTVSGFANAGLIATGPDAYGYSGSEIDYNLRDISNTGNFLSLGDDVFSGFQNIGFDFNFYGTGYNTLRISSNGTLDFDNFGWTVLWDAFSNNGNAIAGFASDLNNPSGNIRYQTLGNVGSREFVVGFYNVSRFYNDPSVTFEMILHEATNNIEFQYGAMNDDNSKYGIGISNTDGTSGLDVCFNSCQQPINFNNSGYLISSVSVPEPSTLAIFALGVIGLASRRFKKQS